AGAGDAAASCALPGVWQRFVSCLYRAGSIQGEDALVRVTGDALPKIVRVPSLAEKEAKKSKQVILSYEGHYFEVTADEAAVGVKEPGASGDEAQEEERDAGDGRMQKAPRTSFWQRFGIARLFRGAPPARTQTDNAKKRKGLQPGSAEPRSQQEKKIRGAD
ncbi:unnamed protein product, partial [Symbiodinium natans]